MSEYSHLTQTSKDRRLWLRVRIHSKQNTNNSFILLEKTPLVSQTTGYWNVRLELGSMESQPLGRPPLIMSWEFRHHLHVNCLIAKPWLSRQAHHVRHRQIQKFTVWRKLSVGHQHVEIINCSWPSRAAVEKRPDWRVCPSDILIL